MNTKEKIAVVGLGYVGLPVALAFGKQYESVVGFDIDPKRIAELKAGNDNTREANPKDLKSNTMRFTDDAADIKEASFYVVTVPTPIDNNKNPDLDALESASRTVGKFLTKGDVVVYESTVYPGVTEEFCGPILAEVSGLQQGVDFHLGYSPERINPGDKERTIEKILKIVSGDDAKTLDRVSNAYGNIIEAGLHKAPSIKIAEAAKVIENTQRDINIALMNELAIIFDRLNLRTHDVLKAAGTKWNFLPFTPGLVGGHCIGVDPYYLTSKAEEVGYHPEVILAGRRINDTMGAFIANKVIKLLTSSGLPVKKARIGICGLTFKENVPDIRNSRVPDIIAELGDYGLSSLVHDPYANAQDTHREYGITLADESALTNLDALILAVPHKAYLEDINALLQKLKPGGIIADIKSALSPALAEKYIYWSL